MFVDVPLTVTQLAMWSTTFSFVCQGPSFAWLVDALSAEARVGSQEQLLPPFHHGLLHCALCWRCWCSSLGLFDGALLHQQVPCCDFVSQRVGTRVLRLVRVAAWAVAWWCVCGSMRCCVVGGDLAGCNPYSRCLASLFLAPAWGNGCCGTCYRCCNVFYCVPVRYFNLPVHSALRSCPPHDAPIPCGVCE